MIPGIPISLSVSSGMGSSLTELLTSLSDRIRNIEIRVEDMTAAVTGGRQEMSSPQSYDNGLNPRPRRYNSSEIANIVSGMANDTQVNFQSVAYALGNVDAAVADLDTIVREKSKWAEDVIVDHVLMDPDKAKEAITEVATNRTLKDL